MNVEAAVTAGIALLDEVGPANWRGRINWGELKMSSGYNCILGQVYSVESALAGGWNGYHYAIKLLELSACDCCSSAPGKRGSATDFGFNIDLSDSRGEYEDAELYRELENEWKRQLITV